MIKRLILLLGLGLLATIAFGDVKTYRPSSKTITITGVASGDDSTAVDSFAIFETRHYANRYWVTIDFDSVEKHEPSGFGLRDSIFVVITTEFAGQRIVLDSTEDSLFDANTLTLNFTSGPGDSLYNFGEQIWLKVRIADTVGASTDSVHNFNFRIEGMHFYAD